MAATPTPKPTAKPSVPKARQALACGQASTNPALAGLLAFDAAAASAASPQDLPVAVAYSGGADSTALLLAACQFWPGQVQAIHIHHGLQAAADDFVQVCESVCAALGVALSVVRVNAAHAPGQSPEDAARLARYAALAETAHQLGARCVLLGQHADDQVETLLLALSRGAGLPGLAGMPERFERGGMAFGRPLLQTPAAELKRWLMAQPIRFIDDPSNADERYTRNKIRARLLPALEEVFPQFRETIARSARHAAQAQQLLQELAADDLARTGHPPAIRALQMLSGDRQANLLRHWLRVVYQVAPSAAQLHQLLRQIAACTTRGHHIDLKVAAGHVRRSGDVLAYEAF